MLTNLNKFITIFFIKVIKLYTFIVSPFLGQNCRFYPNCSSYFISCVENFGIMKGSFLGINRILRCNPYNKNYGVDEAPKNNN